MNAKFSQEHGTHFGMDLISLVNFSRILFRTLTLNIIFRLESSTRTRARFARYVLLFQNYEKSQYTSLHSFIAFTIPGYNHYRRICGLKPASSFEDLTHVLRPGSAEVFAQLYSHVDDIGRILMFSAKSTWLIVLLCDTDLFVGLNHEKPVPDGVVGTW